MAENFMTEHSKIRKKRNVGPIYVEPIYNKTNTTTTYVNTSLAIKFFTGNIEPQKIEDEEVYYNFDKEKFIGNLNGMTKFFVALGSLDSRLFKGNLESKKELHYVHIPRFVSTTENILESSSVDSLRKELNFDLKKLNYGDTFYLESNWVKLEQSELLSNNVKTEKKFVNGIINRSNAKKDKKLLIQSTVINSNEKNSTEKKDKNSEKIVRYLDNNSNIDSLSNTHIEDIGVRPSVCVKYMGNLGGNWPTPQVRTFTPLNFLLIMFYLFLFVLPFQFLYDQHHTFLSLVFSIHF
jgi:hypothetical protein